MRKLTEEVEKQAETQVEKQKAPEAADRWIPYHGELEEATYKDKQRHFKDPNGELRTITETIVAKEGRPQYSVEGQDLLEWRKGRGGTKRRLVTTFKVKFPDSPEGKAKRQKQTSFRAMLRSKGIPGA